MGISSQTCWNDKLSMFMLAEDEHAAKLKIRLYAFIIYAMQVKLAGVAGCTHTTRRRTLPSLSCLSNAPQRA